MNTEILSESEKAGLARAVDLARRGMYSTSPNPRVGAVILQGDRVIAEGWHEKAGRAHAEIAALQSAEAQSCKTEGATMIVTLEPCGHYGRTPPCSEALIKSKIKRLIVVSNDPNPKVAGGGIARCLAMGIEVVTPEAVKQQAPVIYREAVNLNRGFFNRFRRGRPWVMVKMAMSLDGRTATAQGDSQWITKEPARHDGHHWRARACAILTGIGTVLKDDPQMNVRHPPSLWQEPVAKENLSATTVNGHYREPLKVVLDSLGSMPKTARILRSGGNVLSIGLEPKANFTPSESHQYWQAPEEKGRINLWAVVEKLALLECNEVLVEAGPVLTGAFLESGLVDQLIVYVAPKFLGSSGKPFAQFSQTPSLEHSWGLMFESAVPIGDDVRLIYTHRYMEDLK